MYWLAHGAQTGGPDPEFLLVSGALAVVAVVLFVQKAATPLVSLSLLAVAIALAVGAFALTPS